MNALFLINKPTGVSSTKIGSQLRRALKVKKCGHAGTLDLEASGLLLILFGNACRFQAHLLNFDKEYKGLIRFGLETDTDDIFGAVLSECDTSTLQDSNRRTEIEQQVKGRFKGLINQVAPKVSAKKSGGVPDYERVRRGEEVTLKSKEVSVEVLDFKFLDEEEKLENSALHDKVLARYHLRVSSGFYVRSFARDIGEMIGVKAVAESICRSSVGPFKLEDAIHPDDIVVEDMIEQLQGKAVFGVKEIFDLLPYEKFVLNDPEKCLMVRHGNPAAIRDLVLNSEEQRGANEVPSFSLLYFNDEPLAILDLTQDSPSYAYVLPSES